MIPTKSDGYFRNLKYDLPASLVVFLVALPLCMGIALASGAPIISGLVAGIAGGIVAGLFSGSHLAVSGPAAGLTVIVLGAIEVLGLPAFFMAVVIAGLMQLALGYLKAGIIGNFFPVSVIKGMLSAIGLTLILKQIPHALGHDTDPEGEMSFMQPDGENTFSELFTALGDLSLGAIIISVVSLAILILWERPKLKQLTFFKLVPASLVVVGIGILFNYLYQLYDTGWTLSGNHLVEIKVTKTLGQFVSQFESPDFSAITNFSVWGAAFTIALVASLETLLSIEATDKLDPYKRSTPLNRELKAQGAGNVVSGLLGGLPITAVIVRSTANLASGARTKMSTILHGFLLITTIYFIPQYLNLIPLSSLAAILLIVGYKLAKPALFKEMYQKGLDQFIPYLITIIAILLTDLLIGIGVGMVVGFFFVFRNNYHTAVQMVRKTDYFLMQLEKDVSFMNKAAIRKLLDNLPPQSKLVVDGTKAEFIDNDIIEMLEDYKDLAKHKNIEVAFKEINSKAPPELKISKKLSATVAPAREAKQQENSSK